MTEREREREISTEKKYTYSCEGVNNADNSISNLVALVDFQYCENKSSAIEGFWPGRIHCLYNIDM
jgi:hypothetical protein